MMITAMERNRRLPHPVIPAWRHVAIIKSALPFDLRKKGLISTYSGLISLPLHHNLCITIATPSGTVPDPDHQAILVQLPPGAPVARQQFVGRRRAAAAGGIIGKILRCIGGPGIEDGLHGFPARLDIVG